MAIVLGARRDRGRDKVDFTLTLLTCALCICSPLSEERSPPRTRVSEQCLALVYHLASCPCFFLALAFLPNFGPLKVSLQLFFL